MRPKSEKQFKSWSNYSLHQKLRKVLALNSNRLIEIMVMVKADQHQATIIKDSVESEIAVVIKLMMQMMKRKRRRSKLVESRLTSAPLRILEELLMVAKESKKSLSNSSNKRIKKRQFLTFHQLQVSKAELKITMMVKKSRKELSKPKNLKTDTYFT
jgi:hypothetical protein